MWDDHHTCADALNKQDRTPNHVISVRWLGTQNWFKGSQDPTHFIFEMIVGKSRIRLSIRFRFDRDMIDHNQSRFWIQNLKPFEVSDPTLPDNDFKNKMVLTGTTLKNCQIHNLWKLVALFCEIVLQNFEKTQFRKITIPQKIAFSTLLQHLSTSNNNSWWQAPLVVWPPYTNHLLYRSGHSRLPQMSDVLPK